MESGPRVHDAQLNGQLARVGLCTSSLLDVYPCRACAASEGVPIGFDPLLARASHLCVMTGRRASSKDDSKVLSLVRDATRRVLCDAARWQRTAALNVHAGAWSSTLPAEGHHHSQLEGYHDSIQFGDDELAPAVNVCRSYIPTGVSHHIENTGAQVARKDLGTVCTLDLVCSTSPQSVDEQLDTPSNLSLDRCHPVCCTGTSFEFAGSSPTAQDILIICTALIVMLEPGRGCSAEHAHV